MNKCESYVYEWHDNSITCKVWHEHDISYICY